MRDPEIKTRPMTKLGQYHGVKPPTHRQQQPVSRCKKTLLCYKYFESLQQIHSGKITIPPPDHHKPPAIRYRHASPPPSSQPPSLSHTIQVPAAAHRWPPTAFPIDSTS